MKIYHLKRLSLSVLIQMYEEHKLFVKRIGVVGVAQTFQSMKGLIYLPIFTKILGSSGYGVWSLILATIAVLQPFMLLGLQDAILRFLAPLSKEKIVQGRIDKRLQEISLLDQSYIRDQNITVAELVKQSISLLGENIKVRRFARFVLGEGLEKEEKNFADEVAEQMGKA